MDAGLAFLESIVNGFRGIGGLFSFLEYSVKIPRVAFGDWVLIQGFEFSAGNLLLVSTFVTFLIVSAGLHLAHLVNVISG